jgi:hypothetical protein
LSGTATQNFTAACVAAYAINGTITGAPAGDTMTLTPGGATTTTNASGNFIFGNLANGTYTVTPTFAEPTWF